ncbi:hypothetical protein [Paenibacillus sp. FSL R7-0337]|uniref:hypothetical protein n=1 Tax=Paenibacillus sp. FSL R7-0337 TaxID=1926588 RepID=UPI00096F0DE4|nr:hypothetical protein [Paenibacillus sp. FSL R7-0337]OMF88758.1 hypothetical protein BK147_26500 [Paenibacillus sp. FSL R7-0337]
MPFINSVMKVLLSATLVASSFVSIASTLVRAEGTNVGGTEPATGGITSSTAAGQFQTSDGIAAVLQIGFIPAGELSGDSKTGALQDDSKFNYEDTMFYMAPNKTADDLFRKEGSGFSVYDGGIKNLYGKNPLYPNSSSIHSKINLSRKTLNYADKAVDSNNYFEAIIAQALVNINPNNANRTLTGTNGDKPVGTALKTLIEDYISNRIDNSDFDAQVIGALMFNDYLNLIKESGIMTDKSYNQYEQMMRDAFSKKELVLFFQTVVGISVKDGNSPLSRDYSFIPMHDATAWYLNIRKQARPNDATLKGLSANREAEAVAKGGASSADQGSLSPYKENGNLPFTFRTYARDYYSKTLKPVTSIVPLSDSISQNPFGGWGFQVWGYGGEYSKKPAIDALLNVTVVDKNGDSTGEHFTEPVRGWSEDNKRFLSELTQYSDKFITAGMTVEHDNKTYEILPDENAKFTLVDKKDLTDNLNKSELKVSSKGQDGVVSVPSKAGTETWFIELGYDTPEPLSLHKYLGGDSKVGGSSSVDNKYANSGKEVYSNAQLTLFVKVTVDSTEPVKNSMEVPQWRLSQYWGNISPEVTNKSNFSVSLPFQSFEDPKLSPSGSQTFSLVDPDLSNVPWAFSRAKLFNDTLNKNVSPFSTLASFHESGDLLAVKDNGSVLNTRLASWVNNFKLFDGKIGSTSKGSVDNKTNVKKSANVAYGVKSPTSEYVYSETRYKSETNYDAKGKTIGSRILPYSWSGTASQSTNSSDYEISVNFKHYIPKDSPSTKKFKPTSESTNGLYWQTKQGEESISIYPEVIMGYDDSSGNTSVAFTAGEKVRSILPVSYNQTKFINLDINPVVTGMSTATDSAAKVLAARLNTNKEVIFKGSATTNSFDVKGDLEIKTFVLDIGNSAYKNSWNHSQYNTDTINDSYLAEYATKKQETGKWQVSFDVDGKFIINGKDFGGQVSKVAAEQKSTAVKEYALEVRGGRLIGVNGTRDLSSVSQELKDALARMHISTNENVFNTFESGGGDKLTDTKFASLAATVRGSNDIAVGKGWYSEDSSLLVVREYITLFGLPSFHYSDKLPLEVTPDLEAPIDKNKFFSNGALGYTRLHLKSGNAEMIADSSKGQIGVKNSPQFIVPNVSIMDSFGSVQ